MLLVSGNSLLEPSSAQKAHFRNGFPSWFFVNNNKKPIRLLRYDSSGQTP